MKSCGSLFALTTIVVMSNAFGAEEPALTDQQERGKRLYYKACIHCHAPGVWGTNRLSERMSAQDAVLENRTNLPVEAVRTIIRAGIGSMPAFRRSELSDADAQAIAAYVSRNTR
jgi:(+)-pinoresinol hydroxylase